MGCDGGTIPRRNELVKTKKKPETKDKTSHLIFQWSYCNLSQQLLRRPVVTCALGKLYNKSSIIEAIIDKEPSLPHHVKSLRDVLELNLTANPAFHGGTVELSSPYICPITGLEMSGKYRFVALWTCGCVFSERALKQIKTEACPRCQRQFEEMDLVVLNPSSVEDVQLMTERMQQRMKKRRKKKRRFEECEKTKLVRTKN